MGELEAEILEAISMMYAFLGEQVGAMDNADKALEIYQDIQSLSGQGRVLNTKAEFKSALAEGQQSTQGKKEATLLAAQAAELFKLADDKAGLATALTTQSSLLVERGFYEDAPMRTAALKTMRSLGRAVNARDARDFKVQEAKLSTQGNLLKDNDMQEF